jgi:5'-AMP-activated protein kinase, regulatory gamma subunit
MQAAPLWDPSVCQFVGLLKVTDFIDILRHYRLTHSNVASLATRSIADIFADDTIREAIGRKDSPTTMAAAAAVDPSNPATTHPATAATISSSSGFWSADSSTTLKQACLLLHSSNLDFLPIVFPEDMRVLACITYTNMLEHLVTHFREQRRLFDDSIFDLKIGTYHDKLVTVTPNQSLAEALELMHTYNLGALPVVVEQEGLPGKKKIVGVYSRSDITFLTKATDAEDAVANLDLQLSSVLEQQRTDVTTPDALHTCSTSHTLQSIFEYFAQLRFNRLFVVDEHDCLVGVVSARDLVAYFLNE